MKFLQISSLEIKVKINYFMDKDWTMIIRPQEKLWKVRSDVEACQLLAENGVDVESIERKIRDAYQGIGSNILTLSDRELDRISGGVVERKSSVWCECSNDDEEEFSYQFWVSQLIEGRAYRCKKCGLYALVKGSYVRYMTAQEYKDWSVFDGF